MEYSFIIVTSAVTRIITGDATVTATARVAVTVTANRNRYSYRYRRRKVCQACQTVLKNTLLLIRTHGF